MRFYLSHSIRGKYGKNATPSQMKANCDRVLKVAKFIRRVLPSVELYVPAEHEDFVYIAFKDKYLSESEVLEIDCKIIDKCNGVIVFCPSDDLINGGRVVEYRHAIDTRKPVLIFEAAVKAISWLTQQMLRA